MYLMVFCGFFYYLVLVLVYYLIIYYQDIKEKLENEIRLRSIIKETELNLLKSQINPHFLFNSLNSICSLTIVNPSKAQDMIIKLSDFMRYSLSQADYSMTTLKNEIENSIRYLEIEKVRFGHKLIYQNTIDPTSLDKLIPVMLLQPLYENAVKHGVYESTQQVNIDTTVVLLHNDLHISIKNDFDPDASSKKGEGIGLRNIKDRLKLIYHNSQLMTVLKQDTSFEVKLIIPQNNG